MFGSLTRLLRDPLSQQAARSNAQQAASQLGHQRRQRQEVDAYLAQLPDKVRRPANGRHLPSGSDTAP